MADVPKEDSQTQFHAQLEIQKIYVKDISFETPNSPEIFMDKWEPEVSLQLSHKSAPLNDNTHEVVLGLTVTVKLHDKTAFLAEVHLAGIFNLLVRDREKLSAIVGSSCPQILFPYAREVISDLVTRGGFPQLVLAPINFNVLYHQHQERAKLAQAGESKH